MLYNLNITVHLASSKRIHHKKAKGRFQVTTLASAIGRTRKLIL